MTGLTDEQLTDLVEMVHNRCADRFVSRGRPIALGLFQSVAMVVFLIRKNVTQDFAGAVFGVSQPTVSRRWDLLRPLIGDVLAEVVPDPREVVGRGTHSELLKTSPEYAEIVESQLSIEEAA